MDFLGKRSLLQRLPCVYRSLSVSGLLSVACLCASLAFTAGLAAAAEQNPPGDIPDTQVFVTYHSPVGFSLKVPEGWARTDEPNGVRFADKYDTVEVSVTPATSPPDLGTVRSSEVARLMGSGSAVKLRKIATAKLGAAGQAFLLEYTALSAPNPVTNKRLRIEGNRYLYYRNGKLATLDLTAPLGADNADQWKLMAESFRWR